MSVILENTIVFFRNWEALHAKNKDGSRKYKYIINKGSSRSSKTFSLIDVFDIYARQNANNRLTIWRDTKTDCKKTVLSDMLKHHKRTGRYKKGYTFNKTDSIFHYDHNNGLGTTTVEIHGTDDEETVHGLTQDVAWLNEPYKISKDTFDQIDMRSDVVFIDYNPKKESYIENIAKQDNAIVIHSTFRDNPFCPEEQRIKIESYQPISYAYLILNGYESIDYIRSFNNVYDLDTYLTPKEYESKYKKELINTFKNEKQFSSSEYKWVVYGLGNKAENPNKIYHNWNRITDSDFEKIKKDKGLRSYYGLDFGYGNPSACVEVLYDGDRAFYLREKLYKPLKDSKEPLGELLVNAGVPTGNVTYIFCDPQDNLVGVSTNMINDLRTYHRLNAVKAVKPNYSDRINFINNVVIFYTAESRNIESEYDSYEYEFIKDVNTEKPIKKDDHIINAIEYVLYNLKLKYNIKI